MQSDAQPHCAEPDVTDIMDGEIHSSKGTKMTDRVILQREFSELMNGLHGSILKYATDRAEHHQCDGLSVREQQITLRSNARTHL